MFELCQAVFVDSYLNTLALKHSQRVIAYVVGVHVRNNSRINFKRTTHVVAEYLSGSLHRTETAINHYPCAVRPDKQTVAAATAA